MSQGVETESDSNQPPEQKRKGTVFINDDRCKGCSYCVAFCPTGALSMGGRLNRKGYHLPELSNPDKCNGCDMCGMYCPDFAIFGVRLGRDKKEEK